MIHGRSLVSGSDYVELNWTHPNFLPERYQVTYKCIMKATATPKFGMKYHVMTNTQYLSSGTTSFRISGLRPSSTWKLILIAVYNRASIDSGITRTGSTLDKATGIK